MILTSLELSHCNSIASLKENLWTEEENHGKLNVLRRETLNYHIVAVESS